MKTLKINVCIILQGFFFFLQFYRILYGRELQHGLSVETVRLNQVVLKLEYWKTWIFPNKRFQTININSYLYECKPSNTHKSNQMPGKQRWDLLQRTTYLRLSSFKFIHLIIVLPLQYCQGNGKKGSPQQTYKWPVNKRMLEKLILTTNFCSRIAEMTYSRTRGCYSGTIPQATAHRNNTRLQLLWRPLSYENCHFQQLWIY